MYSEWDGGKECKEHYRAVVVTVTVSVIVTGPFPARGADVMLEPLVVGADVAAGFGTAAAGAVETAELVLLAVIRGNGVGFPEDGDDVSLGNEMTTGLSVEVVGGT